MPKLLPNLRQTLIEKAIELSRTGGLSGLKLRDLARECNIALGTLYNYYPTKDSLVLAELFSSEVVSRRRRLSQTGLALRRHERKRR